jgi:glucose-1-phosphate adenylyltransferase
MELAPRHESMLRQIEQSNDATVIMSITKSTAVNVNQVLAIVLGGGQGTRLHPLTSERSKPAVPLAGKYRLVDIPISNCLNSGINRIYLLTQFNSASLHRHISQSYKFDHFTGGFVEILAAEQTPSSTSWYQGTADAVRRNKAHFRNADYKYALILSGDQLYRMDYQRILSQHIETHAELTVATLPVSRREAESLGILLIDPDRRITRFVEKPKDPALQDAMRLPQEFYSRLTIAGDQEVFLASMGIYVFNREVLQSLLDTPDATITDFGKHIIPHAIKPHRVFSYVFQGYWEDIGTIRSFFNANLELTSELPRFNFFDETTPIFSRPRYLPPSKINGAQIDHAIISDGCIINYATVSNSIIGLRCYVDRGARINRTILLGSDFYEPDTSIMQNEAAGHPRIGIGSNTIIENCIVDKNARIGNDCIITPANKPESVDHQLYFIRDGIMVIPKNGIIPHGTKL